jgi:cytochrome b subunit of formate dehydrogenase
MKCKHLFLTTFGLAIAGILFVHSSSFFDTLLSFMLTGMIPGTTISVPYWIILGSCVILIVGIIDAACSTAPLKPPTHTSGY